MACRRSWSMQTKNAARVLPEPVGAEMRVVLPARMAGQPCSWGSVGEPNLLRNHSAVTGWAQASDAGISMAVGGATGAGGMADCNAVFRALFACGYLVATATYCQYRRRPRLRPGSLHRDTAR